MTRNRIAFVAAALAAVIVPFTSEGTVRLSFTENYTPPEADSDAKLFIHIDASDLSTASYDADANGNLRLASIADPRGNGLYASNSLAPYNKATIRPCVLNGRSVLDLGECGNTSQAADLRWCFGGSYTNCTAEKDYAIVYANRDEGQYADPATRYDWSNMWRSGEDHTIFSTNSNAKAADNLTKATSIFVDGQQTGNGVPYPSGYHVLFVHNFNGYTLPLYGVGARNGTLRGGMLIAELYVLERTLPDATRDALRTHLMKKWGIGSVEPYAPPALSGITASMGPSGLESLALAGGSLAPGNGGTATISVPAGFAPRSGDYPLLTGSVLAPNAETAFSSWTVAFSPASDAKAKLAVVNGNVVLRVFPSATVIYMR